MKQDQAYFLRRLKLGKTSTTEISKFMKHATQVIRNDELLPKDPSLICIRWGCTSNIPQGKVLNTSKAIHLVTDKRAFRQLLNNKGLCPPTWLSYDEWKAKGSYLPIIIRTQYHAQGRQVIYCKTLKEVADQTAQFYRQGQHNLYFSAYIPKIAEYRVFILCGRVVWVAKKTPANPDDIAWNVAKGGRFDNVRFNDWPIKAIRSSIEAFNLSGLDFGGVDVMVDAKGDCYILEINAAPSQTSPYRQECSAKAFDYTLEHGKKTIPVSNQIGKYLKYVHPAIDAKALL